MCKDIIKKKKRRVWAGTLSYFEAFITEEFQMLRGIWLFRKNIEKEWGTVILEIGNCAWIKCVLKNQKKNMSISISYPMVLPDDPVKTSV